MKKGMLVIPFCAVVWTAIAGCSSSSPSPGGCSCPNLGGRLTLPADLSAPVSKVSGDSCIASLIQNSQVLVDSMTGAQCDVTVQLENGDSLSNVVTFRGVGGCCTNGYQVGDSSAFEYNDGGGEP
jgi:hypothetical protein